MGWETIYTLPIQAQHKGMISHFNIPMATVMLVVWCVVETQAHVQGDHTERLTVMFEPTTTAHNQGFFLCFAQKDWISMAYLKGLADCNNNMAAQLKFAGPAQ